MHRRVLLCSLSTATITAIAGCSARPTEPAVDTSGPITDWRFRRLDHDSTREPADPPTVLFVEDSARVVVFGAMYGGNPCHETYLESARYDAAADTLHVVVGFRKKPLWDRGLGCPDSMEIGYYETAIQFAESGPETVVAVERSPDDEQQLTCTQADSTESQYCAVSPASPPPRPRR